MGVESTPRVQKVANKTAEKALPDVQESFVDISCSDVVRCFGNTVIDQVVYTSKEPFSLQQLLDAYIGENQALPFISKLRTEMEHMLHDGKVLPQEDARERVCERLEAAVEYAADRGVSDALEGNRLHDKLNALGLALMDCLGAEEALSRVANVENDIRNTMSLKQMGASHMSWKRDMFRLN